ncbi:hypothetical protein K470DRAFT_276135 [Piedraia hortae CBS 480.64]|uniref:Uncharacterized protein n=1 Tax=Piedraia hortae CBS 480.64 TaxID=1314780 RepID=A0A6A7C2I3_9PEZI|nr:hypothetical protein K470DRAFT_276135 [Piedraia hortae CBS 480.64]
MSRQDISFKTVPGRNRTQKWSQAKTYNYDGDDWGGYDDGYYEDAPQLERQRSFDVGQEAERRQFSGPLAADSMAAGPDDATTRAPVVIRPADIYKRMAAANSAREDAGQQSSQPQHATLSSLASSTSSPPGPQQNLQQTQQTQQTQRLQAEQAQQLPRSQQHRQLPPVSRISGFGTDFIQNSSQPDNRDRVQSTIARVMNAPVVRTEAALQQRPSGTSQDRNAVLHSASEGGENPISRDDSATNLTSSIGPMTSRDTSTTHSRLVEPVVSPIAEEAAQSPGQGVQGFRQNTELPAHEESPARPLEHEQIDSRRLNGPMATERVEQPGYGGRGRPDYDGVQADRGIRQANVTSRSPPEETDRQQPLTRVQSVTPTPPGAGLGAPRSGTANERNSPVRTNRVRAIAENYNLIEAASNRNSNTSLASWRSGKNSVRGSEENLSLKKKNTGLSIESRKSTLEDAERRLTLDTQPSQASFRPHLPGEWISTAPTPVSESPTKASASTPSASPSHLAQAASRFPRPSSRSPKRNETLPQAASPERTPKAADSGVQAKGALDQVKDAGTALGASLMATAGLSSVARDFASNQPTQQPEQPDMRAKRTTGDVAQIRPAAVRWESEAPSSVANSIPPSPTPPQRPAETRAQSGYFADVVQPLHTSRPDSDLQEVQPKSRSVSNLSDDVLDQDFESDRLRKEIVASLDPFKAQDDIYRTQDALDAPDNAARVARGEEPLPGAEIAGQSNRRFSWEGQETPGVLPVEHSVQQPVGQRMEDSPETPRQQSIEEPRESQVERTAERPTVITPERPYERPETRGLHVTNTDDLRDANQQIISPTGSLERHGRSANGQPVAVADSSPISALSDAQRNVPDESPSSPLHSPRVGSEISSPVAAKTPISPAAQTKIPPFREILAIRHTPERIQTYNDTRQTFADMDTGLPNWLSATMAQRPEYAADLEAPVPSNLVASRQQKPSILKIAKGFSNTDSGIGERKASLSDASAMRGKEIMKNAKGLFAMGRNKFGTLSGKSGGNGSEKGFASFQRRSSSSRSRSRTVSTPIRPTEEDSATGRRGRSSPPPTLPISTLSGRGPPARGRYASQPLPTTRLPSYTRDSEPMTVANPSQGDGPVIGYFTTSSTTEHFSMTVSTTTSVRFNVRGNQGGGNARRVTSGAGIGTETAAAGAVSIGNAVAAGATMSGRDGSSSKAGAISTPEDGNAAAAAVATTSPANGPVMSLAAGTRSRIVSISSQDEAPTRTNIRFTDVSSSQNVGSAEARAHGMDDFVFDIGPSKEEHDDTTLQEVPLPHTRTRSQAGFFHQFGQRVASSQDRDGLLPFEHSTNLPPPSPDGMSHEAFVPKQQHLPLPDNRKPEPEGSRALVERGDGDGYGSAGVEDVHGPSGDLKGQPLPADGDGYGPSDSRHGLVTSGNGDEYHSSELGYGYRPSVDEQVYTASEDEQVHADRHPETFRIPTQSPPPTLTQMFFSALLGRPIHASNEQDSPHQQEYSTSLEDDRFERDERQTRRLSQEKALPGQVQARSGYATHERDLEEEYAAGYRQGMLDQKRGNAGAYGPSRRTPSPVGYHGHMPLQRENSRGHAQQGHDQRASSFVVYASPQIGQENAECHRQGPVDRGQTFSPPQQEMVRSMQRHNSQMAAQYRGPTNNVEMPPSQLRQENHGEYPGRPLRPGQSGQSLPQADLPMQRGPAQPMHEPQIRHDVPSQDDQMLQRSESYGQRNQNPVHDGTMGRMPALTGHEIGPSEAPQNRMLDQSFDGYGQQPQTWTDHSGPDPMQPRAGSSVPEGVTRPTHSHASPEITQTRMHNANMSYPSQSSNQQAPQTGVLAGSRDGQTSRGIMAEQPFPSGYTTPGGRARSPADGPYLGQELPAECVRSTSEYGHIPVDQTYYNRPDQTPRQGMSNAPEEYARAEIYDGGYGQMQEHTGPGQGSQMPMQQAPAQMNMAQQYESPSSQTSVQQYPEQRVTGFDTAGLQQTFDGAQMSTDAQSTSRGQVPTQLPSVMFNQPISRSSEYQAQPRGDDAGAFLNQWIGPQHSDSHPPVAPGPHRQGRQSYVEESLASSDAPRQAGAQSFQGVREGAPVDSRGETVNEFVDRPRVPMISQQQPPLSEQQEMDPMNFGYRGNAGSRQRWSSYEYIQNQSTAYGSTRSPQGYEHNQAAPYEAASVSYAPQRQGVNVRHSYVQAPPSRQQYTPAAIRQLGMERQGDYPSSRVHNRSVSQPGVASPFQGNNAPRLSMDNPPPQSFAAHQNQMYGNHPRELHSAKNARGSQTPSLRHSFAGRVRQPTGIPLGDDTPEGAQSPDEYPWAPVLTGQDLGPAHAQQPYGYFEVRQPVQVHRDSGYVESGQPQSAADSVGRSSQESRTFSQAPMDDPIQVSKSRRQGSADTGNSGSRQVERPNHQRKVSALSTLPSQQRAQRLGTPRRMPSPEPVARAEEVSPAISPAISEEPRAPSISHIIRAREATQGIPMQQGSVPEPVQPAAQQQTNVAPAPFSMPFDDDIAHLSHGPYNQTQPQSYPSVPSQPYQFHRSPQPQTPTIQLPLQEQPIPDPPAPQNKHHRSRSRMSLNFMRRPSSSGATQPEGVETPKKRNSIFRTFSSKRYPKGTPENEEPKPQRSFSTRADLSPNPSSPTSTGNKWANIFRRSKTQYFSEGKKLMKSSPGELGTAPVYDAPTTENLPASREGGQNKERDAKRFYKSAPPTGIPEGSPDLR